MKDVSNEEFEKAYKDPNNKNIIKTVTKKYSGQLSQDCQKSCGMHGLWRCIQNHDDKYGRKFTTSLFIHVDWECKREIGQIKRKQMPCLGECDSEIESMNREEMSSEILEPLTEKQREIMYQRFYENRTLEEIGKKQGYSKEAARQNINKILSKLRETSTEDFGV